MYKLFVLLTSLFLLNVAKADDGLHLGYSGFATYTLIEQKSWHENAGNVSVNLLAQYGDNWAAKAQLSNQEEPVRRAVVEYSWGRPGNNFMVQLGRIPRIPNLMSDVYGNPDEWNVSILPLSTYNRRKVHSLTFNALDGVKAVYDRSYSDGNIRTTIDYGKAPVERADWLQMEFSRRPYNPGWGFETDTGDVSFTIEATYKDNWTALVSKSHLNYHTALYNPRDRVSFITTRLIKNVDYFFDRYGLRYGTEDWSVQYEHGENELRVNGVKTSTARDDYILGTYFFNDDVSAFAGFSHGKDRGNPYSAQDRFLGVTHRFGNWTTILEYHNGQNSWQRYGSNEYQWHSWVLSGTLGF